MRPIVIHPHPIAVHFANGLLPVSVFFLGLFWITGRRDMEIVAFALLATGTAGSLLAVATGLYDWKKNYRGAWVPVFKKKLALGVAAVILGAAATALRGLHPGLLYDLSPMAVLYILLNLAILACVTVAGYLGGRLVFQ